MNRFLLFTKDSCGPCGLVKKYIKALHDERASLIEQIELEDFSNTPIPEENLALAKKYGVTATPVFLVISPSGLLLEKRIGGLPITQSVRKLWGQYGTN
jgi:thioredoxin-related protein